VSWLGIRKYRDPIGIGLPVEYAAAFEEASKSRQIAVLRRLYRALFTNFRCHFKRNKEAWGYIATN